MHVTFDRQPTHAQLTCNTLSPHTPMQSLKHPHPHPTPPSQNPRTPITSPKPLQSPTHLTSSHHKPSYFIVITHPSPFTIQPTSFTTHPHQSPLTPHHSPLTPHHSLFIFCVAIICVNKQKCVCFLVFEKYFTENFAKCKRSFAKISRNVWEFRENFAKINEFIFAKFC